MRTLFSFNLVSFSVVLLLAFSCQADPTRPPSGYIGQVGSSNMAVSPASALKLQIIQNSNSGKAATINGQYLQLGDQYQGYTLTAISTAAVVLSRGDERRILQLHNKTIKNYD